MGLCLPPVVFLCAHCDWKFAQFSQTTGEEEKQCILDLDSFLVYSKLQGNRQTCPLNNTHCFCCVPAFFRDDGSQQHPKSLGWAFTEIHLQGASWFRQHGFRAASAHDKLYSQGIMFLLFSFNFHAFQSHYPLCVCRKTQKLS